MSTFYFDASDGAKLHCHKWVPAGEPCAIIHIAHGMAEGSHRYARLAAPLVDAGYVVYANDHRGHAKTAEASDLSIGHASEDHTGFDRIVTDLMELVKNEKKDHPGLPMVLLGHSMGSIIGLCFAGRYGDLLTGLVLTGPSARPNFALKQVIPPLTKTLKGIYGRSGVTPLFNMLSFEAFNKQFGETETEFDWLSRDKAEVQKYIGKDKPKSSLTLTAQFSIHRRSILRPRNEYGILVSHPPGL
jgi:alpha-beta hydrolase superfamily lysophospholipase